MSRSYRARDVGRKRSNRQRHRGRIDGVTTGRAAEIRDRELYGIF